MDLYFGDVPLCYTNSVAMVLNSYGHYFHPEYLEAIIVMEQVLLITTQNTHWSSLIMACLIFQ